VNSKFRIKNHAVGTISKGNATGYTTATCEIGFEIGTLFQKKSTQKWLTLPQKLSLLTSVYEIGFRANGIRSKLVL
jgi:hypothetical protein